MAGAAALLLAGCSSGTAPDEVVSAGPPGSGNPESPAIDNPTTSTSTTTVVDEPTAVSTTDPHAAASTSTSTSVPPAVSVPTTAPAVTTLATHLYWVRTPGDPRVIDIPGYRDPESGPLPLVVYGAVTNEGSAAVPNPYVTATWLDARGSTVASFTADVVEPGSTTAATSIEPGQSGDVIIVVTDQAVASQLADLSPELTAGSR